jgi:hypothetical protein
VTFVVVVVSISLITRSTPLIIEIPMMRRVRLQKGVEFIVAMLGERWRRNERVLIKIEIIR